MHQHISKINMLIVQNKFINFAKKHVKFGMNFSYITALFLVDQEK